MIDEESAEERAELTRLLREAAGDPAAGEALLPLVYDQLRRLAGARMDREAPGHTLQPTALVHEAWLRLLGPEGESLPWENRAHFFGAAAQAMRRVLVERARRVRRERHGGHMRRRPLDDADGPAAGGALDPLRSGSGEELDFEALDVALSRLAERDPRAARVVELRFFAGLSVEDVARTLEVSPRTVAREWNVARAWLARAMQDGS